jgi:hypothetical protein
MRAVLKAADQPHSLLPDVVARIETRPGERLRIWAEGLDGWSLDYWSGLDCGIRWCAAGRRPDAIPGRDVLTRSRSGRIFAPSGELKWRVMDASNAAAERQSRLVFLGDRDWLPGRLSPRDELDRLKMVARRDEALLWGQKTGVSDGSWIELRIPHRFQYPVEDTGTGEPRGVRVITEIWLDQSGQPHFHRLCDLVAFQIQEG